jgi:serine/threonine protein kinase
LEFTLSPTLHLNFWKDKIRNIALKLISALCFLKKESIIHGDIKPENIFINWKDHSGVVYSNVNLNNSSDGKNECTTESKRLSLADLPDIFDIRLGLKIPHP